MTSAAIQIDSEIITQSELSQKRKNVIWCHLCVETKKMLQMNLFTMGPLDRKQTNVTRGKGWGNNTLGNGTYKHTLLYTIDKQQGPTI